MTTIPIRDLAGLTLFLFFSQDDDHGLDRHVDLSCLLRDSPCHFTPSNCALLIVAPQNLAVRLWEHVVLILIHFLWLDWSALLEGV